MSFVKVHIVGEVRIVPAERDNAVPASPLSHSLNLISSLGRPAAHALHNSSALSLVITNTTVSVYNIYKLTKNC